ncbi:MAG TPA: GDSL-type esterase/lipase family protein [Gemmataceae bacterium]|nr:GDSL-type esterase/lipase family protein [Gemmataceae bacterium]
MTLPRVFVLSLTALLLPSITRAADPDWVEPMKKVHARFSGPRGTFAQFGDSITVTMAFWAPLAYEPKGLDEATAKALKRVKAYQQADCWNKWKGSAHGSEGGMTIRWAHDNVEKWLKKLNPEVVLVMFGTNDLVQLDEKEYVAKTREVVKRCLDNGSVVILSTIPPRSGQLDKAGKFAGAVKGLGKELNVPVVDYFAEVLKRRPDDWDGALPKFKDAPGGEYEVPTPIARDGVHPSNPKKYQTYDEEGLSHNGYVLRNYLVLRAYDEVIGKVLDGGGDLAKAVSFYASFDEEVRGDVGGGGLTLRTRSGFPDKGTVTFEEGFNSKVFRIAKNKGVSGGALEVSDVLPNNGRVFFPVKGHLAYKKGGWGGAVSVWCNTDPNTLLKTKFCDPIQITQKGASNGGIWFDFNDARPRDLRHGSFPALAEAEKPMSEDDPKAPMVRLPKIDWKAGDWHHVVLSWKNFDSGKPDAVSALYIDGQLIGEVKDRAIAMGWDAEKAGVYVGVNYIGLLDELALFNRALTAAEVKELQAKPGLLSSLKKTP